MALVYNYNDDVAAAVFISGLQVSHTFYKHLVKHDVTKMRDILSLSGSKINTDRGCYPGRS